MLSWRTAVPPHLFAPFLEQGGKSHGFQLNGYSHDTKNSTIYLIGKGLQCLHSVLG